MPAIDGLPTELAFFFRLGRLLGSSGKNSTARVAGVTRASGQRKRFLFNPVGEGQTANRYLALIRAILRTSSLEWEWIDRVPKVKMYPEPKRRVRWITQKQAKALLEALPEHQRDIALFALATGLRQSNVVRLRWSQVDLERSTAWIAADEAKGGEDIHVSVCDLAVEVLERQLGKHPECVFTYKGKPVRYVNTKAWRNALKRSGIADFRWHDLRHTWASWLIQNGTPLFHLQEMGGAGNRPRRCGDTRTWRRRTWRVTRR